MRKNISTLQWILIADYNFTVFSLRKEEQWCLRLGEFQWTDCKLDMVSSNVNNNFFPLSFLSTEPLMLEQAFSTGGARATCGAWRRSNWRAADWHNFFFN